MKINLQIEQELTWLERSMEHYGASICFTGEVPVRVSEHSLVACNSETGSANMGARFGFDGLTVSEADTIFTVTSH